MTVYLVCLMDWVDFDIIGAYRLRAAAEAEAARLHAISADNYVVREVPVK